MKWSSLHYPFIFPPTFLVFCLFSWLLFHFIIIGSDNQWPFELFTSTSWKVEFVILLSTRMPRGSRVYLRFYLSSSLSVPWIYPIEHLSSSLPRQRNITLFKRRGILMLSSFLCLITSMTVLCSWTVEKVQKRRTIVIARLKISVR